uniref:Uncharacterized protein n=1 Tax=Mycena chlorophos TaxID=658473 RepID=A0ABQ0L8S1_MYCCL|nr:predicted protein [Mycena chlorophos]
MTLVSRYTPPTLALIDALSGNQHSWVAEASPTAPLPTLPSLRSLALREYDEEDGEWERRLVDIAKKRSPVLKSIWLDDPTLNPSLNHRSLKVLREKLTACEVELVCSYDGDMGSW